MKFESSRRKFVKTSIAGASLFVFLCLMRENLNQFLLEPPGKVPMTPEADSKESQSKSQNRLWHMDQTSKTECRRGIS